MLARSLRRITMMSCRPGYAKGCARLLIGFVVTGRFLLLMMRGMLQVAKNNACDLLSGVSTGYCGQVAAAEYYPLFDIPLWKLVC
ncbi:MAG: hypothetical protein Q7T80_17830 [Methanoregula sp.]|nr:hypothetical protein [Methanoregula sp.]